jgi:hypothetical protein
MSGPKSRGARRPLLTAFLKHPSGIYPFRDWDAPLKQVVFQALNAAWESLTREAEAAGGTLLDEQEPAITVRLEKALNDIQNEPEHPSGFSSALFQTVVRGDVTSYDQSKLEKRPDLTFRLISVAPGLDRSLFALFAECKLVGPRHPIRLYCMEGVHRFVCGDYAWAMPTGLMVGYTHPPYTIPDHLASYLLRNAESDILRTRALPRPVPTLHDIPPIYETRHDRPWVFPEDGRSPGEIALLHVWLPLPEPRVHQASE